MPRRPRRTFRALEHRVFVLGKDRNRCRGGSNIRRVALDAPLGPSRAGPQIWIFERDASSGGRLKARPFAELAECHIAQAVGVVHRCRRRRGCIRSRCGCRVGIRSRCCGRGNRGNCGAVGADVVVDWAFEVHRNFKRPTHFHIPNFTRALPRGPSQAAIALESGDIVQTDIYGVGAPPDWDGTAWADALPRQTHDPFTYTWRDDGDGNFPPGRLDFLLYSDAVQSLEHGFVLRSEALPADVLAASGMLSDDTGIASDHFPVVCDLMATAVAAVDSDGDGLDDAEEMALGTDPRSEDLDMFIRNR